MTTYFLLNNKYQYLLDYRGNTYVLFTFQHKQVLFVCDALNIFTQGNFFLFSDEI